MANKPIDEPLLSLDSALLWQFSLAVYPQLKTLCLRWQNDYHANINVLLALSLAEQQHWQLAPFSLAAALKALTPLNSQITQGFRQQRSQLACLGLSAAQQQQLKQGLLQAELVAEQLEQQLLVAQLRFHAKNNADNLSDYLQQLQVPSSAQLRRELIDLRQASAQFVASLS
ncbi:DUF2390 domain-containing protein [Rheinheimera sp. UJ51]|uniref:DUF2390 domain-containing protein n=1 Tax=Rheinheimera sp. UJ51 TaxID=2892446 RepID=UPI001E38F393|nr:DUF2390 domain-containing protein [Rheinheimera sp. UJ51]MCC5452129.1 DUF2390 domain-containing protein [Rheinheimera sp. UJ51]